MRMNCKGASLASEQQSLPARGAVANGDAAGAGPGLLGLLLGHTHRLRGEARKAERGAPGQYPGSTQHGRHKQNADRQNSLLQTLWRGECRCRSMSAYWSYGPQHMVAPGYSAHQHAMLHRGADLVGQDLCSISNSMISTTGHMQGSVQAHACCIDHIDWYSTAYYATAVLQVLACLMRACEQRLQPARSRQCWLCGFQP